MIEEIIRRIDWHVKEFGLKPSVVVLQSQYELNQFIKEIKYHCVLLIAKGITFDFQSNINICGVPVKPWWELGNATQPKS